MLAVAAIAVTAVAAVAAEAEAVVASDVDEEPEIDCFDKMRGACPAT